MTRRATILKEILIVLIIISAPAFLFAQVEKKLLGDGNDHYEEGEFIEAQTKYEEALSLDKGYGKASYNLGNSLYKQGNLGEAANQFEIAAADAVDKEDKAKAYHNIGNSFLNSARMIMKAPQEARDSVQAPDPQQLIQASIEAYKKSLRNIPTDEETRYNLAYAQKMLQDGGGGGEGESEQEQDQEQNQEQEEKKEDEKGNEEKKQEKPKEDEGGLSDKEIEKMLKQMDRDDQELQEKLSKERMEGRPKKTDKDW